MEEKSLNHALYKLASELKKKSVLEASDGFIFDSSGFRAKVSDYTVWELLKRLGDKGFLTYEPAKNQAESALMLTGFKDKHDTIFYSLKLNQPQFDNYLEEARNEHLEHSLDLDLGINGDLHLLDGDEEFLIYRFKPGSQPEALVEYLLIKQNRNKKHTRDKLKAEGIVGSVKMNQWLYKLDAPAKKILEHFLERNTQYEVQLNAPVTVSHGTYKQIIESAKLASASYNR